MSLHTYNAGSLTELHDQMAMSLVFGAPSELDIISAVDVQKHNVVGVADSMEWDFDLKSMWLTKSRWSMMVRQYLDPDLVQDWIDLSTSKIATKGRGTAVLRTKNVKPRGGAATGHTNKETRRWGSCMLNLSYKALPRPTITLHSRTSYLGYIGALDLTVGWMLGKYLAAEMGLEHEQMRFVWMVESTQWHNFKSLAMALNHPDEAQRAQFRRLLIKPLSKLDAIETNLIDASPGLLLSRKWLKRMMLLDRDKVTLGDMTYNTYRRIRRRWHTEVLGYEKAQEFEGWSYYKNGPRAGEQKEYFKAYKPLPNVHVDTLDLSPIGMPLGKRYGGDYVPDASGDEDDDDE